MLYPNRYDASHGISAAITKGHVDVFIYCRDAFYDGNSHKRTMICVNCHGKHTGRGRKSCHSPMSGNVSEGIETRGNPSSTDECSAIEPPNV